MNKIFSLMELLLRKPGRKEPPANEGDENLDDLYKKGNFDFLYSLEELSHYMVILGYIRYFVRQPVILDVGCGEGRLADLLSGQDFKDYHGIDISSVAIQRARKKKLPGVRFTVADYQTWNPDRSYDLIIFCETLYYAPQPREIILRYAKYLKKKGYFILSVYRYLDQERVWDGMDQVLKICGGDTVQNSHGTWDIRVYKA